MSPCPSPRHAMRRRTGATPLTIFRVPRASRFDSGRFDSGRFESGDDIGEQLVLAPTDLVAQLQLLLLEPGELELVGNRRRGERDDRGVERSEEHTSELQSLMRISYAVFCLKKKKK